jgi:hypothetical protein
MAIVSGLAAINKAIEQPKFTNDGPKARWLKINDGQTVRVRFLQEIDPDSKNYVKEAGLGIVAIEHQNPTDYKRKAVCTIEDEGQCYGCEEHRRNPKSGWKAKPRFYINVLVDDLKEEPYVAIMSQGIGSKSATAEISQYAAETGSITNVDWKIKRSGTSTDTNYSIIPLPSTTELDTSKYELYDLKSVAVRSVPYSEQENFYKGIVSEESSEASTSSSVEW